MNVEDMELHVYIGHCPFFKQKEKTTLTTVEKTNFMHALYIKLCYIPTNI